jgi:hypothetical protein
MLPGASMNAPSSFDRESFQKFLANAYAVQESGLDRQWLSAIVELQRSIATGEPGVERAMHLIADRARNVANAAGIAVALLKGDQLIYRAGSGSAADYVGRGVTAFLSASAQNEARGEILRVENADTDTRIEADVCRQFGAKSLLMVPIFRERTLGGVLEVLFDEAHAFQDREVRAYRLMAGLVEEAMSLETRTEQQLRVQANAQKKVPARPSTVPYAIDQITFQMRKLRGTGNLQAVPVPRTSAVSASQPSSIHARQGRPRLAWRKPGMPRLRDRVQAITTRMQETMDASVDRIRWNMVAAAVVAAIMVVSLSAYNHHTSQTAGASAEKRAENRAMIPEQQAPAVSSKPSPADEASTPQTALSTPVARKALHLAFKRVQAGPNEVDEIADDVTIRHFVRNNAPRIAGSIKQVNVGRDVTVRYFASKPAVPSQEAPVSAAGQAAERSLPAK